MKVLFPVAAAREAVSAQASRPATALLHDVPGDLVAYDAGELHGIRAGDEQFVLAAIITPRPGAR